MTSAQPLDPPRNIEIERALLAALLVHPEYSPLVADTITADDFYLEKYGQLFRAIVTCYRDHGKVDIHLVRDLLSSEGKTALSLMELGEMISEAALEMISPDAVKEYALTIRDCADRRRLAAIAQQAIARAYDRRVPIDDVTSTMLAEMTRAIQRRSANPLQPLIELTNRWYAQATQLIEGGDALPPKQLPTGFPLLDTIIGGLRPGELIVIAARPGVGKTSFALSVLTHVCSLMNDERDTPNNGVLFSLEMKPPQLVERLLAMQTGIDLVKIRNRGPFHFRDIQEITRAAAHLSETRLWISDTFGVTVPKIREHLIWMTAQGNPPDLVVVDYLQLLRPSESDIGRSREQIVGGFSRDLKALATDLNLPIIALAQLSRAIEQREDQRPKLSDLRESGSIEQDADIVMFLTREELHQPDTARHGLVTIHIAKNRNGPTGTVPVQFQQACARFLPLPTLPVEPPDLVSAERRK